MPSARFQGRVRRRFGVWNRQRKARRVAVLTDPLQVECLLLVGVGPGGSRAETRIVERAVADRCAFVVAVDLHRRGA